MKQQIIKQIKLNGYRVEEQNDLIFAYRDNAPGMLIKIDDSKIIINSHFNGNQLAKADVNGLKSYINDLNGASGVTCFYTGESCNLEFAAYYFGTYDEYTFAQFIRFWEFDTINVLDNHSDSFKYLGSDEEVAMTFKDEYESIDTHYAIA